MRHLDDMYLAIFKTIRNICLTRLALFCPQYQNAQLVQISAKNIFYIRSYLEKMTQIGSHYQNILRGLNHRGFRTKFSALVGIGFEFEDIMLLHQNNLLINPSGWVFENYGFFHLVAPESKL